MSGWLSSRLPDSAPIFKTWACACKAPSDSCSRALRPAPWTRAPRVSASPLKPSGTSSSLGASSDRLKPSLALRPATRTLRRSMWAVFAPVSKRTGPLESSSRSMRSCWPDCSSRQLNWPSLSARLAMSMRSACGGALACPAGALAGRLSRSSMLRLPSLRLTTAALSPWTPSSRTCTCRLSKGMRATETRADCKAAKGRLLPRSDKVTGPSTMPTSGHRDNCGWPSITSVRWYCSSTARLTSALRRLPSKSAKASASATASKPSTANTVQAKIRSTFIKTAPFGPRRGLPKRLFVIAMATPPRPVVASSGV